MEYNIYCLSNASTNIFENVLTFFRNLFPNSLDIKDDKFEIGLVSVGIHLNYDSSPGLFQVRSNIISDVPNGNDFSTILFSSSLPINFKKRYFYQHLNRINYYPVRHTNISTISVKLTDVLGNQLPIKEGQPSIVHFHLREKEKNMDHDITYVRLDSKVDAKLDFENTNSSFWTHLKHPIYLNGDATMALSDISFPNTVKPIAKLENKWKQKMFFNVRKKLSSYEENYYNQVVPDIVCYDKYSLMEKLNEAMPEPVKTIIQFTIQNEYFTIVNMSTQFTVISLPKYLQKHVGFINEETNYFYNSNKISDIFSVGIGGNEKFVMQNQMECNPNSIPELIKNKLKQKMTFILKKESSSPEVSDFVNYSEIVPDITCDDEISLIEKLNEALPEPVKTMIQFKIKDKHFMIINKSTKPIVIRLPKYLFEHLGFINEETSFYYSVNKISEVVSIGIDGYSEFVSQNQIGKCKPIPEVIENKKKEQMSFTVKEKSISFEEKDYYSKVVPDIICHDEISLMEKLNETLPEPVNTMIQFTMEDKYLTIMNKSTEQIAISLPKFLQKPLGFINEETNNFYNSNKISDLFSFGIGGNEKYVAQNKIEVCNQIPGVMVLYANFVQYSIVGNNFYPILKIIPTNINQETKEQQYTSMYFDHLEFIKCNVSYLDNMKFELRGLDGELIEFGNDRRVVLNIVIKNPK